MISLDILNGIRRVSQGLFRLDMRGQPANDQDIVANLFPRRFPVVPSTSLPMGGHVNVAKDAATYWAMMPLLELPQTGLTPHYLQDFIANPPQGAV